MNADTLTQTLHGVWYGSYGCAPCPVCQPEARADQRALTLSQGEAGLLLHCKKAGCSFRDILAGLKLPRVDCQHFALDSKPLAAACKAYRRSDVAATVWQTALPIHGTPAEAYLRSRAIFGALPDCLRYQPKLRHGSSGRALPGMVALIEGAADFGVHRTWLRHDGSGKADLCPAKAMLGASAGGAVHLSDSGGPLIVTEGIETALSVICLLNRPASVWAALSTSGMRSLVLPGRHGNLILAPDGDAPGRAAACALARRAKAAGWQVGWRDPGDGIDWNDILMGGST